MQAQEFIASAYAEVQSLTDEGVQMHRRAVRGKPLVVFEHGRGRGGRGHGLTLRVQGQFIDRGDFFSTNSPTEVMEFKRIVGQMLAAMPVPVPA